MRDTNALTMQQEEELQEYGSLLAKQGKDLLHKGLSLGHLTPDQQTLLSEHCIGLVELGTILFHQEAAQ
ncbi:MULTISPECIES: hypothetical protein [unclassified Saccharibacter]|uniref:hypothetical protein n=1 Tax=unclassified Saccharibacter TaxID=2648722 RepID=UPI001327743C|nr:MULTISPECIES: hypothetical protein [unclassified Saccharibacter]MXV35767.1 hypothetical protein [Saccharibacter sp. EH611]MXV35788.1 hypothetical protein [Saccharibacter sp. EH611]MXV35940.1 hypothetical protein [Saccharibacter sp. EH611]MXV57909.1 hypothetical protein [Saccharibacter sp. EH70]MXV58374.1 hypothetical protein [Saccharibacter sp. EH70]